MNAVLLSTKSKIRDVPQVPRLAVNNDRRCNPLRYSPLTHALFLTLHTLNFFPR